MTNLGRGRSYITYTEHNTVIKRTVDGWEPHHMSQHPDVFVPVLKIERLNFTMPRYDQAEITNLIEAAELLKILWIEKWRWQMPGWNRQLRAHLTQQNVKHSLGFNALWLESLVRSVNHDLPYPCKIHGDPTLANLLVGPDGPRWIDPLTRPYIPGDPHVDLGKLYQSCAGYERVLQGERPVINTHLMNLLAKNLNLNSNLGLAWCRVHFIRLLPYQYEDARPRMIELLRSIPESI